MPGQGIAISARLLSQACSRFPPPPEGPTPRHPHGEVGRGGDGGRGHGENSAAEDHAADLGWGEGGGVCVCGVGWGTRGRGGGCSVRPQTPERQRRTPSPTRRGMLRKKGREAPGGRDDWRRRRKRVGGLVMSRHVTCRPASVTSARAWSGCDANTATLEINVNIQCLNF